ncbi:MAG: hypothetical protein OXI43_09400 [Candidatus Poribacteria bacterium]|nr:hypothetical protein [Candidatus Poribacteria bacterium]
MELRQELQGASKIREWANHYNVKEDIPIENLVSDVKDRGYLKKRELIEVARWKVPTGRNSVWRIETMSPTNVERITRDAFLLTDDSDRLRHLYKLEGVDSAIASAILHWFHNDRYPIWDKHARWSIQLAEDYCSNARWKAYTKFCRAIANKYGMDMRTLDRALFQYGKSNS